MKISPSDPCFGLLADSGNVDEQTGLALRAMPENEPIADLPVGCRMKVVAAEATRLAAQTERTQRPACRRHSHPSRPVRRTLKPPA